MWGRLRNRLPYIKPFIVSIPFLFSRNTLPHANKQKSSTCLIVAATCFHFLTYLIVLFTLCSCICVHYCWYLNRLKKISLCTFANDVYTCLSFFFLYVNFLQHQLSKNLMCILQEVHIVTWPWQHSFCRFSWVVTFVEWNPITTK